MKTIKKLLKYLAIFILSLVTYLLIVTLLSFVSVNEDLVENQKEIPIYILTNGVHTDIVLQIKNEHHDWSTQLKFEHTKSKDTTYQYVALGWGDKGFYLETPTWADLKASTAIKAASGLSTSAMHVTFYKHLKENQSCKKIQISLGNYKKLVAFIKESFQTKSGEFLKIETDAVYGKHDVFYEANGSYSLFYTCNSWANQALKAANQKAALWTISDSGIFRHYE
ncbi:TIGR02117 family protein [Flavobacterium aquaticum]|uniref:TIGR02117 family protein n=2 Tax=Flavobacterium proteolyticum TaxID=2911683 RepID=A0ABR9WSI5_9FLAO|nr:TIGR02117 family protein [Flavobacterium proteolyticum]MBE9576875.1 TIGR02117 family protein [Flavobacterium proteolyticum]